MFRKRTQPRTFHDVDPAGGTPPATPPAAPPAPAAPPVTPPAAPPVTPPAPPELPADVQAQLAEFKKLKADKEKADREALSETERLKKDLADANARALDALRKAVAAREGIPPELAGRLSGTTEEEIQADAKTIAALIKSPPNPANPANTGTPPGGDPPPAKNTSEVDAKQKELTEAIKAGRRMDILRLERELAALKAKKA